MNENKIFAYCGIDCGACPACVAMQNDAAPENLGVRSFIITFKKCCCR